VNQRTLLCVHAHPDDESISTGGILARYSAEGYRTVLVTCTNGECGDGANGEKPGEEGHNPQEVTATRYEELERSAAILGITHLVKLGFRDSGMMGWASNDFADSFWRTDVELGARRLAEVMDLYQPQVVVTYDENGFYGHPDHIQANRITHRAIELTQIPQKLYYTAVPRSIMEQMAVVMAQAGIETTIEDLPSQGTPNTEISAWVDVSAYCSAKYQSLLAHASQAENMFFLKMGEQVFSEYFPIETFLRIVDKTGSQTPEDDLFAGVV